MVETHKKHFWYYVSVLVILLLGFSLALFVAPDKPLRLMVIVMTSCLYVVWALLHHYINHDLTTKVVFEYVLVTGFGLTVSLFLFNV